MYSRVGYVNTIRAYIFRYDAYSGSASVCGEPVSDEFDDGNNGDDLPVEEVAWESLSSTEISSGTLDETLDRLSGTYFVSRAVSSDRVKKGNDAEPAERQNIQAIGDMTIVKTRTPNGDMMKSSAGGKRSVWIWQRTRRVSMARQRASCRLKAYLWAPLIRYSTSLLE